MRRGKLQIFYFFVFCLFFGYPLDYVKSEYSSERFLNIPFSRNINLIQGWTYTGGFREGKQHSAIDYFCEIGEKIFAAEGGVAMSSLQIDVDLKQGYGNYVFIKHENGYASLYAHLHKVSDHITTYPESGRHNTNYHEWTPVRKGEYIGECGMSGTDNPHLHFEVTTGKYATGRVDSYDLYQGKAYYPPNQFYKKLGNKHLWESDPPEYRVYQTDTSAGSASGSIFGNWWKTLKEWITIGEDASGVHGLQEDISYDALFVGTPYRVSGMIGGDVIVQVRAKNTGTHVWYRDDISLNVLHGVKANSVFRHSSWITDLRPTLLDNAQVRPGEYGTFTFTVRVPKTIGEYRMDAVPVLVGTWERIGSDSAVILIRADEMEIKEDVEDRVVDVIDNTQENEEKKGIIRGIKEVIQDVTDTIKKQVTGLIEHIPKFFGGGSSGATPVKSESPESQWFSLTYPEYSDSIITSSSVFVFLGDKSINTFVRVNVCNDCVTYDTQSTWSATVPLVTGEQKIIFSADGSGDVFEITVVYDPDPPDVPDLFVLYDESASEVKLSWHLSSEELDVAYTIEWRQNTDEWNELISGISDLEYAVPVEKNRMYGFRIRARDVAGNISEWSQEVYMTVEWSKVVVINEIAWAGVSGSCSTKEWVELYNPSDTYYSFAGWSLNIESDHGQSDIALVGGIDPGGYYLIAHDKTLPASVIVDTLLPSTVAIPDTGARITLMNNNQIIDEVNQSGGWFGGVLGAYPSTLERIAYELPSFASDTWRSSTAVREGIRTTACGHMAGSPRMSNDGYAYISSEAMPYYHDDEGVPVLVNDHRNPYIFGSFTVDEGKRMRVESGVTLLGAVHNASIIVNGMLEIIGTTEDRVVFTSRSDGEILGNESLVASPGQWQHIIISGTGMLHAMHTSFLYAGRLNGQSVWCPGCVRSQVLVNQGGEVVLDHVEIGYGYQSTNTGSRHALIYSAGGTLTLRDVHLHHGLMGLFAEGGVHIETDGAHFEYFDTVANTVQVDTLPQTWESVTYGEQTKNYLYMSHFIVEDTYIYTPGRQYLFGILEVPDTSTLILESGSTLFARVVKIYGELLAEGTEELPIEIRSGNHTPFEWFGFFPGARGTLSHVYMHSGGHQFSYPFTGTQRTYMLWSQGADVTISHSRLMNARRPGGIFVTSGGEVDIRDTEIGWDAGYQKPFATWQEYGLYMYGTAGYLENVTFRYLNYAVYLTQNAILTYDRMTADNFVNLYPPAQWNQKNWFPQSLFPF